MLSFLLCLPGPWMGFLAELPPLCFLQMIYLYVIFDAGWEAHVDGAPAEILPVNLIARGIWLQQGEHEVRMRYQPPGLTAGTALSGASLAALGLGGLAARRRRVNA